MPPLSIFFPLKFKFVASSPTLGLDEAGRTDKLQISTLFFLFMMEHSLRVPEAGE